VDLGLQLEVALLQLMEEAAALAQQQRAELGVVLEQDQELAKDQELVLVQDQLLQDREEDQAQPPLAMAVPQDKGLAQALEQQAEEQVHLLVARAREPVLLQLVAEAHRDKGLAQVQARQVEEQVHLPQARDRATALPL